MESACFRSKAWIPKTASIEILLLWAWWILAKGFIPRMRCSSCSSSMEVTRSILLSRITSAKAICSWTSSLSQCSLICFASTTVTTASSWVCDRIISSTKKDWITGAGSANPVVSITRWSNRSRFCIKLPKMRIKSPRTVQQMQPLFISTISSSASIMSWLSIPTSPNSLTITATLLPCSAVRMRLSKVVLPAPK